MCPNLYSSRSFFHFFCVLHFFTSNFSVADVPRAKAEQSGFTMLWAKILLVPLELAAWHINLMDLKSVNEKPAALSVYCVLQRVGGTASSFQGLSCLPFRSEAHAESDVTKHE